MKPPIFETFGCRLNASRDGSDAWSGVSPGPLGSPNHSGRSIHARLRASRMPPPR